MSLSWNEIKERASRFSKEWETACNEEAEAKPFLVEFFNVFGISQRKVATFEHKVKKLDEHDGYIDLLWKGNIIIEMKSKGKNLDKAQQQAKDYLEKLPQYELPKYILVSDFDKFRLTNIDEGETTEFNLKELVKNIHKFGFIAGYQKHTYKEEDPVNIEAAVLMGNLHDKLKSIGYSGHSLEKYLVRLLFCLFADDTGIFEKEIFQDYIQQKTNEDGSDLAYHLAAIFNILNLPKESRLSNTDESLLAFPYVNGKLFEETLPFASFDSKMRQTLLDCCVLDWSKISPAIFGSLFQSVMDDKARRNLGAHYTSEKNILKLIKPLFLDNLWKEYNSAKGNVRELKKLQLKISNLRFLDPACGCGNFLIISYRELRLLEMEIVKSILGSQQVTEIGTYFLVDVDKFYGIEYEEFPAQIAQVAMWLIDHQMNMQASVLFGDYFVRLPLKKSATIKNGNALQIDWQSLLNLENSFDVIAKHANIYIVEEPATEYKTVNVKTETFEIHKGKKPEQQKQIVFNYIIGNPPFIGKHLQNTTQKTDMVNVFAGVNGAGVLDYVTAWYIRAAQYLQINNLDKQEIKCAFVSTNSIVQGEQVGIIWNELFCKYNIKIHFAHRTFSWSNEAKGNAAVHVVIIGFSNYDITEKYIYEYENIKGESHEIKVKNINPYLIEGKDIIILSRSNPINDVPVIFKGNQPTDGGFLIMDENEKNEYLKKESGGEKFIKNLVSGKEFLNGENRYCFWIVDSFEEINKLPLLKERIYNVKQMRLASTFEDTRKLSEKPYQFRDLKNPKSFIVIPATTSENRKYIPFGFLDDNYIPSNSIYLISDANLFHFGILMSSMHMAWVKYICGRLKSDYRYSKDIVYNNYAWPENPTEKQIKSVESSAQKVLNVRKEFPDNCLADLYDPLTMPPNLVRAHQELDKAVDLCYRSQPFINETKRIEYLFELYDKYTAGLFVNNQSKRILKKAK